MVFLRNNTLLPAIANVLETFLEAVLWKTFQLFRRIPNYVSRPITKAPSIQCCCQSREQANVSWTRSGWCEGCSIVVTLLFAEKSLTKSDRCAGAMSWSRNQLLVLNFRRFSFWPHNKGGECCRTEFPLERNSCKLYMYVNYMNYLMLLRKTPWSWLWKWPKHGEKYCVIART
jgi:hypothetical protein